MDKYDYPTLVMEKAYCEMEEEELEFCKEVEAEYYLPRIKKMQEEGYNNTFICSCIHDLYIDYLIYDDFDLARRAGMTDEEMINGDKLYWSEDEFNYADDEEPFDYEEDNPLRN